MGVDQFFASIRSGCSNELEYATELIKARGVLLEGNSLTVSDNAEKSDAQWLKERLLRYNIGDVIDGHIVLTNYSNIEKIFNAERIGGEAAGYGEGWDRFCRYLMVRKVPLRYLEPFIARYIKAISACSVKTWCSCDGCQYDGRGKILVDTEYPSEKWHALIIQRVLKQRFNLKWSKNYSTINFSRGSKWETYIELNRAAAFLYQNRKKIRQIKSDAVQNISRRMISHLSYQDVEQVFSDAANQLFDALE